MSTDIKVAGIIRANHPSFALGFEFAEVVRLLSTRYLKPTVRVHRANEASLRLLARELVMRMEIDEVHDDEWMTVSFYPSQGK